MEIQYIEDIIKDINAVLISKDSHLSDSDKGKLEKVVVMLEVSISRNYTKRLTEEQKAIIIQALIMLMEILNHVGDHFK